jgi:phosphatidylserine decarboxylase
MAKEGVPFVLGPLATAVGLAYFSLWIPALGLLLLSGFMLYFFRDPARTTPDGEGIIVSAADGRVTRIESNDSMKLVSVFLSPLDVHINRSPISGQIAKVTYVKGRKTPATSDNSSLVNERNSLEIVGDSVTVTCTQIAGILARRIVCWAKQGDTLERGQKFGLIKFSSRTDLLMPPNVAIEVRLGDKVKGGETIIGRFQ